MINNCALLLPLLAILSTNHGGQAFVFPVSTTNINLQSHYNTNNVRINSNSGASRSSSSSRIHVKTSRAIELTNAAIDYSNMTTLPRHPTNTNANEILAQTEQALRSMQESVLFQALHADENDATSTLADTTIAAAAEEGEEDDSEIPIDIEQESVYANSYVDLGKVDTVGFDFDYTLVTYTKELLELIYDMALKRLVEEKEYPIGMLTSGLRFDPFFSIRGELSCIYIIV